MSANKDQISRPSKGRFFAATCAELLRAIGALDFSHSESRKRIDLILRNPEADDEQGLVVAVFLPADALIVYSFTEGFSPSRGAILINTALREFREIDKHIKPTSRRSETTSYRAYLCPNNALRFTRRVRAVNLGKYRGGAKFSNAFKPTRVNTREVFLREVTII